MMLKRNRQLRFENTDKKPPEEDWRTGGAFLPGVFRINRVNNDKN